jgi:hypothetical protein
MDVAALLSSASALLSAGRAAEALEALGPLRRSGPAKAHVMAGVALSQLDRMEEARAAFQAAYAAAPRDPGPIQYLASTLYKLGRPQAALEAIAAVPEGTGWGRDWIEAQCRLVLGDWTAGWRLWERRPTRRQGVWAAAAPDWTPGVSGDVVVWSEQGAGDAIQAARFLAPLAEAGPRVWIAGPPPLTDWLADWPGVAGCAAPGARCDAQIPFESLQAVFAPGPDAAAMLAPPVRPAHWRDGPLRVGLAWRGNPERPWNDRRSIPPALLAGLTDLEGVAWFSLLGPDDHADVAPLGVADASAGTRGWRALGGFVESLDLVVSVDTAANHVAGAVGTPSLLLLALHQDCRWGLGDATVWYPGCQIVRQSAFGDWTGPIAQAKALVTQMRDAGALTSPATHAASARPETAP